MQAANENEKKIRIAGTLDAIAMYLEKTFDFSSQEATKVTTLLWLEQEIDLAEGAKTSELNVGIRSLQEFEDDDIKAKGMIGNSRFFMNIELGKVKALRLVPVQAVEWILSEGSFPVKIVKAMLGLAVNAIMESNPQLISDGVSCICMRAWHFVAGKTHVGFKAGDIMPDREVVTDENRPFVCELTDDDGRQSLGNAKWKCPFHKGDNYCNLTCRQAEDILILLRKQGILEDMGDGRYAFF